MRGSYRIPYSGPDGEALLKWLAAESLKRGGVIVCRIIFCDVWAYWYPRLPQGNSMPSDFPMGYWKQGRLRQWSEARVIRDQNTTPVLS